MCIHCSSRKQNCRLKSTTTNEWRHFGQLEQRKSSVLFPIQSEKSPDSGFFTCDPTKKCIMPSSHERHKGIIGRRHDLRLFIAMIENLTKSMSQMARFLFGSSQWVVERQHFYQATQNGAWTAIACAKSKMHILKSSGFWFHNIITYWVHPGKGTCMQPSKLKLLLGHHLATKSFGWGRLFLQIKSPAAKF